MELDVTETVVLRAAAEAVLRLKIGDLAVRAPQPVGVQRLVHVELGEVGLAVAEPEARRELGGQRLDVDERLRARGGDRAVVEIRGFDARAGDARALGLDQQLHVLVVLRARLRPVREQLRA